jgi:hypothetical protein
MPLAAIFAWPLIVWALFGNLRIPLAMSISLVAGYLLLPERTALDLPMLPSLDKHTVPALTALLVLLGTSWRDARPTWLPSNGLARLMVLALFAASFVTVATNLDPVGFRPGLRLYDGFSAVLSMILQLLPLLLARKFLARAEDHRTLLAVLCVAGLCYSVPILYEIRMSPQLNIMVYGFFPHAWAQHMRGDGFRPVVFLSHGLWLAIFMSVTVLATLGASRLFPGKGAALAVAGLWLLLVLFLSRSLGALMITLLLGPVALFAHFRVQLMVAALIAAVIVTYPLLRGAGLVPINAITDFSERISEDRAESLKYRLLNEETLLAKAGQRPAFGWGGWGRSRTYTEDDRLSDTADGYWIIILGQGGWVRYLGEFGLLAGPLILMGLFSRRYPVGPEAAVLALALTANLIDLIPNGTATPITWLLAGALWGRLETAREPARGLPAEIGAAARPPPGALPNATRAAYTRQRERVQRKSALR